jgi:hypothetical protein
VSETSQGVGRRCLVCSMPIAAGLGSCPNCAYDHRAAAEAQSGDEARADRTGALGRWRSRRHTGRRSAG